MNDLIEIGKQLEITNNYYSEKPYDFFMTIYKLKNDKIDLQML